MNGSELELDFPGLRTSTYVCRSPKDSGYNCVAFAVGDKKAWWQDIRFLGREIHGYYWPPGGRSGDTIEGWVDVFELHGYQETRDRTLEPEYEKIAIYASAEGPEHVARQGASGVWFSKMGAGVDIEHTLEALEGDFYGKVVKIMRRECKGGRVLE